VTPLPARLPAAVVAAAMMAIGLRWGTFAVGGSDSSCYAHQAERWAAGQLQVPNALALEAPWPSATLTLTPAGHIPSTTVPGASVPICPPGLSIAMAAFRVAGGARAIFLAVPLLAALLVWSTYLTGSHFSPRVGLAAALVTACSPVALIQVVQPMSDVPAAACWVLATALVLRNGGRLSAIGSRHSLESSDSRQPTADRLSAVLSGVATSAAILMRPNLLPLGLTLGLFLLLRPGRPSRERIRDAAAYAAASAPGCVAIVLIQQSFYGSPFGSGYGSIEGLFSLENVRPNAVRYARWFWDTQTPAMLLALAAPFVVRPRSDGALLAVLALVNLACYLPYVVFDEWWYLRFLLPAIPLVIVLAFASIDAVIGAQRPTPKAQSLSRVALAIATVVICVMLVGNARALGVLRVHEQESRFVRTGLFVADRLPANAIVLTGWQSGSIQYYARRQTLAWDVLEPDWLDRSLEYLRTRGYEPYLLLERWEDVRFRERFAANPFGALDWPPIAEVRGGVRIFRFEDQARYRAGASLTTEYVR
jgi:hypothetical protein